MEINDIYDDLTEIETYFNYAGAIPIVGCISGGLRGTISQIQAVASIVLLAAAFFGKIADPSSRKWENLSSFGYENLKHGVLNMLRGTAESVIGITIIGSFILYHKQSTSSNQFAPLFPYRKLNVTAF